MRGSDPAAGVTNPQTAAPATSNVVEFLISTAEEPLTVKRAKKRTEELKAGNKYSWKQKIEMKGELSRQVTF